MGGVRDGEREEIHGWNKSGLDTFACMPKKSPPPEAMPHFSLAVAGGQRTEEAPIRTEECGGALVTLRAPFLVTRATCGSPSLRLSQLFDYLTICFHLAIIICLTIYHICAFDSLAGRSIYHQACTILTWIRAIGHSQPTPSPRSHPLPVSNLQMVPTW